MINKIIGYVLAAVGVFGVAAYSIPEVKSFFPAFTAVPENYLLIASIVLVGIGAFAVVKSGGRSKKVKEVPIYQGKDVVGYRRH